jgi:choline dehydrogenase-like flavoprotein
MVYIRGAREDYAEWPTGWHWDDVVPDFEAIERVIRPHQRPPTEFTEACIAGANEAGFAPTSNMNDGNLRRVFGYEFMNYENGDRRSSYVAFLREATGRPNLTVTAGARARRVHFDRQGVARSVEFEERGQIRVVHFEREVILCAGALETPKLLMLSGVGPRAELERHGIDVVCDAPGVGESLHDHPNVTLFFVGHRSFTGSTGSTRRCRSSPANRTLATSSIPRVPRSARPSCASCPRACPSFFTGCECCVGRCVPSSVSC